MATPPTFSAGAVLTAAQMNKLGMFLIQTVTIGAGTTSLPITDAFSADYDNYRIIISGGVASATTVLQTQLGTTATGYYYGGSARTYAGVTLNIQAANSSSWYAGEGSVNSIEMNIEIQNPFTAKNTTFTGQFAATRTDAYWLAVGGYLANTTSYTDLTITPSGGATLTGGTVYVYGYRK
jgi:hypothetical protein